MKKYISYGLVLVASIGLLCIVQIKQVQADVNDIGACVLYNLNATSCKAADSNAVYTPIGKNSPAYCTGSTWTRQTCYDHGGSDQDFTQTISATQQGWCTLPNGTISGGYLYKNCVTDNHGSWSATNPNRTPPSNVLTPSNGGPNIPTTNSSVTPTSTSDFRGLVHCDGSTAHPCDFNALMELVNTLIKFLLFDLAIPITAIMVAYAGFKLVTSGGSTEARDTARKVFTSAITGFIIALAGWLIVEAILSILGYNGAWIGFPVINLHL